MYPFAAISGLLGGDFPDNILDFKSSFNHRALLMDNGALYTQGSQSSGALGNGVNNTTVIFTWFHALDNVQKIWTSYGTILALTNDGKFMASGDMSWAGLGTTTTVFTDVTARVLPVNSPPYALSDIAEISIGQTCMLILLNNGSMYGMGTNTRNCLGRTGTVTTPTLLATNVKKCTAGLWRTCYLTNDGKFYRCGYTPDKFGSGNTSTDFSVYTQLLAIDQDGVTNFMRDYYVAEDNVGTIQALYVMSSTDSSNDVIMYTNREAKSDDTRPTRGEYRTARLSTITGESSFLVNDQFGAPGSCGFINGGAIRTFSSPTAPVTVLPSGIKVSDVIADVVDLGLTNITGVGRYLCARGVLYVSLYTGDVISGGGQVGTSWVKVDTIPKLST